MILYLDIDGVINTYTSQTKTLNENGLVFYDLKDKLKKQASIELFQFDKQCSDNLNELVEEFDFNIVISSAWRNLFTISQINRMFENSGINRKALDIHTPNHTHSNYYRTGDEDYDTFAYRGGRALACSRASEIQSHQKKHFGHKRFLILDDVDDGMSVLFNDVHFVRCLWGWEEDGFNKDKLKEAKEKANKLLEL